MHTYAHLQESPQLSTIRSIEANIINAYSYLALIFSGANIYTSQRLSLLPARSLSEIDQINRSLVRVEQLLYSLL